MGLLVVYINMDDSDDECQVIHCTSFVDPKYLQHLRCLLEHHQLLVNSVRLQLSSPVFTLSARNAQHYDPQSADSAFQETRVMSKLLINQQQSKIRAVRSQAYFKCMVFFGGVPTAHQKTKVQLECCAGQHYEHKWWNRELTLKCKLKCFVKPMKGRQPQ